ncbi:AraC family transcriptional regulator ligand-binding domain-containing protein, partial [Nocardia salmonicida]|uniref:AraC family transcriptional regulator ligand-binding domain-containing protein n=1 Tax=Nocardia salmonicida TaxID=53431 RepID=UPI0033E34291
MPIDLVLATVSFAMHRGWDVNDMLAAAGVSPMLLAEGRSRVTEEQITRFTQELWRRTDDEMFGLGTHPLPRGSFRLLCYGVMGAPDLGAMLARCAGFGRAMPALPPIRLEVEGDLARVSVEVEGDQGQLIALDDALLDDALLGNLRRRLRSCGANSRYRPP